MTIAAATATSSQAINFSTKIQQMGSTLLDLASKVAQLVKENGIKLGAALKKGSAAAWAFAVTQYHNLPPHLQPWALMAVGAAGALTLAYSITYLRSENSTRPANKPA